MNRHIPLFGLFFKFLLFDAIWCSYTTFTPFSDWESYATALLATLALSLPYVLSRRPWVQTIVMILTDVWIVCNLMYYRTYYTAIPPSSYFLAGNLADFLPSVVASIRWVDLLFPLSTVITAFLCHRFISRNERHINLRSYVVTMVALSTFVGVIFSWQGGFVNRYRSLSLSAHAHASGPVLYTLFGTLCYNIADELPNLTEAQRSEITAWLDMQPQLKPLEGVAERDNCIFILAESLESWCINLSVEGKEITPHLNALLRDSTSLYAPYVQTQVNGGRSIDGQLLTLAGMLPLQAGAYSCRCPHSTYLTLPKALKELKQTRNYLFTVDKSKTWNQGIIAEAFGIDTLLSYPDFQLIDGFGNRKRLGDKAFFNQCAEKMVHGEVWPHGEKAFLQFVTYSGHSPFKLPEELKTIHLSDELPEMMNDYLTMAHYTDEAIGEFVTYLKSRPDYERTLIVITGDHEGLADNRRSLCQTQQGRGVVSDQEYTPFIVIHSPKGMVYDQVMGQVDIYPTLLQLMGVTDYAWHGLGQSIFDTEKRGIAVTPRQQLKGDTLNLPPYQREHLRQAPIISDRLIRFNLLKELYPEK